MKIEFYKHMIGDEEKQAVLDVMISPFLTTGPKCAEFEDKFKTYLGQKYCTTVSSCTNGLFLLLKYFNVGPGDSVIVPSMTFAATANVVEHCGATPLFVDVDKRTGLLDLNLVQEALENNSSIVGIIPVHLYGNMVDMKRVYSFKEKYNIRFVIEDSAHCVEGVREGYKPGTFSDAAAFSFYATKNLACGEGGAVTTNDSDIHEFVSRMRLHGMSKSALMRMIKYEHYDITEPGYKSNLTDIQAAMLIPQLAKLDIYLERRAEIAQMFMQGFVKEVEVFENDIGNMHNAYHLFPIMIKNRDKYIEYMRDNEINVVVNYRGVHEMSYYKNKYGDLDSVLPNTKYISDHVVSLPFYPKLTNIEVEHIIMLTNNFVLAGYTYPINY